MKSEKASELAKSETATLVDDEKSLVADIYIFTAGTAIALACMVMLSPNVKTSDVLSWVMYVLVMGFVARQLSPWHTAA